MPPHSLAPHARRRWRPKPLAPRLTRAAPREAATQRGPPQVHGGNLVRDALRPEVTAAAEGCRDTTGAPLPHHHGGHWPTCRGAIGRRRTDLSLMAPCAPPGRSRWPKLRPGSEPEASRSGRASQTHTGTGHRQSPSARPPSPAHKHCKRLGISVRALVSGPRGDPPARPIPLSPAPCDTPPRVGPRGTGLFSRRCAWATNRPCDGRYPTR